jgi:hypothetical protein
MTDLIKKEKNEQIERLKKELEELDELEDLPPATSGVGMQPPATSGVGMQPPATSGVGMQPPVEPKPHARASMPEQPKGLSLEPQLFPSKNITHPKEESDDDESVLEIQKKPTRPRTAKQIEQFKKVVENKMKNAAERKQKAELKAEADKLVFEQKLVHKAIAVKKKQIRKQKIIDDISSGEEGDQVIQKMKPVKAKPAITVITNKYKFI